MLKRLIETALPLLEVSEQSAREKSLRTGNISTMHIWWARRPLATCRAAVFASLIPDPDDPECPEEFHATVKDLLGSSQFKPKSGNGATVEDTPRNRCLEFIKHLVKWENSTNSELIGIARQLIVSAHSVLSPAADTGTPTVLDPFAGGGAIPLEAVRLGCKAHGVELNPVAYLIELCTFVYPQRFGQANSRSIPEYIKRLCANIRSERRSQRGTLLFDEVEHDEAVEEQGDLPSVNIELTEEDYLSNPLAADVKFWGHWVFESARREVGELYSTATDLSVPVGFLWARTITCPNPTCRSTIPLLRQLWLCKKRLFRFQGG